MPWGHLFQGMHAHATVQHLLTLLSSLLRHGGLAHVASSDAEHLDVLVTQGLGVREERLR